MSTIEPFSAPTPPLPAPLPPPTPAPPSTQLALAVYILYLVSYVVGITALVGVVIAHVEVGTADPLLRSHYQFQIRSFWVGVLYFLVGMLLLIVIVGIFVLLWWFIWSMVRNIKGLIALNDGQPIANPTSWLFG